MSTRPNRPPLLGAEANSRGFHETFFILAFARDLPRAHRAQIKGLVPDEVMDVNLMKGAQREAAYRAVNPMMALPALIDAEGPILLESWRSSNISTRRIRTRRCCRATPGAALVCEASHKSSLAITPADRAACARISGTRIQAR